MHHASYACDFKRCWVFRNCHLWGHARDVTHFDDRHREDHAAKLGFQAMGVPYVLRVVALIWEGILSDVPQERSLRVHAGFTAALRFLFFSGFAGISVTRGSVATHDNHLDDAVFLVNLKPASNTV